MRARAAIFAVILAACADTSPLDADQEARLAAQGIVQRADNLVFRHSQDVGRRDARHRDRRASIVVTRQTVLIHERGSVDFLIEPASRRWVEVHRDGDRVRINAGTGGSTEVWSFVPPGDAAPWVRAIRDVVRASASVANRDPERPRP